MHVSNNMEHREGNRQSEPSMSLHLLYLDDVKHAFLNPSIKHTCVSSTTVHKPYRGTGGVI